MLAWWDDWIYFSRLLFAPFVIFFCLFECINARVSHRRRVVTHACYDFILWFMICDLYAYCVLTKCRIWRALVHSKVKMTLIKLFRVEFIMTTAEYLFIFLWFFYLPPCWPLSIRILRIAQSNWNEKYFFNLCLERKMTVKTPFSNEQNSSSLFWLVICIFVCLVDANKFELWSCLCAISRWQNCGARRRIY